MADSSFQIKGLRELGDAMRGLSDEVNYKLAVSAVGAGAQVVKRAIVSGAPVADESTYKHLGVTIQAGNIGRNVIQKRIPAGQTDLTAETIVTIRSKRNNADARRVATFFEFGTVSLTAKPFFRKGFDSSKVQASLKIAAALAIGINKKVAAG